MTMYAPPFLLSLHTRKFFQFLLDYPRVHSFLLISLAVYFFLSRSILIYLPDYAFNLISVSKLVSSLPYKTYFLFHWLSYTGNKYFYDDWFG